MHLSSVVYYAPSGGVITAFQVSEGNAIQELSASASAFSGESGTFTQYGKTVHYASWRHVGAFYNVSPVKMVSTFPNAGIQGHIAWAMVYGTITHVGTIQDISMSWKRPIDGETLEGSFSVFVNSSEVSE